VSDRKQGAPVTYDPGADMQDIADELAEIRRNGAELNCILRELTDAFRSILGPRDEP
jgi:hypothetical protein